MMVARKTKIKNIIKNCGTDKARKADSRKLSGWAKKEEMGRFFPVFYGFACKCEEK